MPRGVGPQGNVAIGVMHRDITLALATTLVDHLGGHRLRRGTQVILRGILGRGQSHRGILGMGPLLGQVSALARLVPIWEKVNREVTWCML